MTKDIYERLAAHMSGLAMGPPYNEHLVQILRESLTAQEAEVLLAMPSGVGPFQALLPDEIAYRSGLPAADVGSLLRGLSGRGLVYQRKDENGGRGYCLHQFGYGMPQAIFWPNEDTPYARRMAELCVRHSTKEVLVDAFGGTGAKVYRWIPAQGTIEVKKQAVLPYAGIEHVIAKAQLIALVNCNCRVMSRIKGRSPCRYPLEVCMKYDELAEYVAEVGIGRKVSRDEAMEINRKAEQAGCVHFADNVLEGEVKHTCNCCPCCCWSLGNFKRRRIPRDILMSCQFIRQTDPLECDGCGLCVEACPIDAVSVHEGLAEVDKEWCIGCGVCASSCPNHAIAMVRRKDTDDPLPDFISLSRARLARKS